MALLHVYKFDEESGEYIFFDRDGGTTHDREQAEIWMDGNEAALAAGEHGASLLEAFDERDDDDGCDA